MTEVQSTRGKVLITGAGGTIGSMLASALADRYDLRLHYRVPPEQSIAGDVVVADITNLDATLPIAAGIDTVVHLAGDPRVPASFESVLEANIRGTYHVLEAARQAGVRRVVFASTNHVMGMHDRTSEWPVYNSMPQRPDSLYGVSKAFGENLGRYYHDEFGLGFIALRIGWYMDTPDMTNDIGRGMWLSPRDCAQVFQCAIETEEAHGVFYAISDNPNRRWDLTDTMLKLGYRPQDSWTRAVGLREAIVPGARPPDDAWPDD